MAPLGTGRPNIGIEQPCLLLVEGSDDEWFFRRMIEKRSLSGIQIFQYSERGTLGDFLADVLMLNPEFSRVNVIGVVKDADNSYQQAFQSIGDSLRRSNLPVPSAPLTYAEGMLDGSEIRVAAYVMPDNVSPGDLETLCLSAVSQSPTMPCVDHFFSCLQSIGHIPKQESKARLRAFLSTNLDNPNLLIGQAIAADVLPWDSPAFVHIHQFLDMLATSEYAHLGSHLKIRCSPVDVDGLASDEAAVVGGQEDAGCGYVVHVPQAAQGYL